MITYKTSVLIGAAMQMGALIGGMDEKSAQHLYGFGVNIGVAFQMQDDVLDTFGEPKVGKQAGGDIIQNKKTYLYLKALELASNSEKEELLLLYKTRPENPAEKIARVKQLFKELHVTLHCEEVKNAYRDLALSHLNSIKMSGEQKKMFESFADYLLTRSN